MNKTIPEISIQIMSCEEEYNQIWDLFWNMDWFRKNNIRVSIPQNLAFYELFIYAPNFYGNNDKERLYKIFKEEIYDGELYKENLIEVEKQKDFIINKFENLRMQLGDYFRIYDKYLIKLTRYSPGGQYNIDFGLVLAKIDECNGQKSPFQTIMHEIIHLGIEESIVKENMLTHSEKESVVNWIGNMTIDNYKIQKSEETELFLKLKGLNFKDGIMLIQEYKNK